MASQVGTISLQHQVVAIYNMYLLCACVHVYVGGGVVVHTHAAALMWKSEGNLRESVPSWVLGTELGSSGQAAITFSLTGPTTLLFAAV